MGKKIKKTKIFTSFFSIVCFASFLYLAYSLYLLTGIETIIRYICITILFLINIIIIILAFRASKKRHTNKIIIFTIILLLLIGGQGYLGYFIHNAYSSVNKMNKDEIIYETNIIVLKKSNITKVSELNKKKIGYVNNVNSIDNYVLAKEIIEKENLSKNNTILKYEDLNTLLTDLYSKDLDAVLITSNYIDLFSEDVEEEEDKTDEKAEENPFKNIKNETKSIYSLEKKYTKEEIVEIEGESLTNNTASITEPFTILVMGIDSTSKTLNKNAIGNGDALIVVTFNPKTLNATILTIPRDTYVPISCNNNRDKKINSAAYGGISCMIKTIQNFLGININQYIKINFKGVVNLVEALGGINVEVPYSFCEQNSSRQWGKNTVYVKKGLQHLNGEQALALARNRKTNKRCPSEWQQGSRNDYVRGQNQQIVVQAIINKAKSIKSPTQMLNLLDAISKSIDTSFSTEQLLSFYNIAKDIIKTSATESTNVIALQRLYLSGRSQCIYEEGMNKDTYPCLYNEIPNTNSVKAIKNAMKANLGDNNSLIKKFDFSINETYNPPIIGKSTSGVTLLKLLGSFIGKTEDQATGMCSSRGIKCTFEYKITDASRVGKVYAQSYNQYKRVDRITSNLVLTIGKASATIIEKVTTTTTTIPQ